MAMRDDSEMFADTLKPSDIFSDSLKKSDMFNNGEAYDDEIGYNDGPLEDSSLSEETDKLCTLCKNQYVMPRLLSCLHVFCEACLNNLLMDEGGDNPKKERILVCPTCKQETKVGVKGAASLPCDYVLTNLLDMMAINSKAVICTSCKTDEKAVARCSDCANFLCPNCNTAHLFMRCFENHHVISFEDLKESMASVPIHKPVLCDIHTSEPMKFFCYSCQVALCNDCVVSDHAAPHHRCERMSEGTAERQRAELGQLVGESEAKVTYCRQASRKLGDALTELQAQHDTARGLIMETFHSYKVVLEKCRDEFLEELKALHSKQELVIMDTVENVEKVVERIEDSCSFTKRLLEHGDAAELLSLRRVVATQLLSLINNTPRPELNHDIEFTTDMDKFRSAVKASFGHFKKEESPVVTANTTPQLESSTSPLNIVVGATNGPSSVTSSPVSMPSSFDGDMYTPSLALPPPLPLPIPTAANLTSIQEYNLQQLAHLAAEKEHPPTAPLHTPTPSNPSPTPSSFSLEDLFRGDMSSTSHAINNLQALAKLGNASLNEHGRSIVKTGVGLKPYSNNPEHSSRAFILNFCLQELENGAINGHNVMPVPCSVGGNPLVLAHGATSPVLETGPSVHMGLNGASYPPHSPPAILAAQNPDVVSAGVGSFLQQMRMSGVKLTPMQIRCKFGQLGNNKSQFNSPHGFCLGGEEDIIVADTNNHRIQVFEKAGTYKFQFGNPGKEEGQLWYPRKVAVMKASGKFVVCDRGNERSRMQIFTKNGHFIKKIAIRYIDIVAGLAVSSQGNIVAVDSVSPTVFKISDTGDLLSWFDCSEHMREPSDIAINGQEYFVCDFKGHCVVVFDENGSFLRRIGGENVTNFPNGIDISDAGDVLVGDSHGNRFHVAVFSRDGIILCEFECPYVKVSRCCGLKITSEGYIVTLAKNNHHVLILNTLYIA